MLYGSSAHHRHPRRSRPTTRTASRTPRRSVPMYRCSPRRRSRRRRSPRSSPARRPGPWRGRCGGRWRWVTLQRGQLRVSRGGQGIGDGAVSGAALQVSEHRHRRGGRDLPVAGLRRWPTNVVRGHTNRRMFLPHRATRELRQFEVLVVLRASPVTAPRPTTVGECRDGGISVAQHSGGGARAVGVLPCSRGFQRSVGVHVRVE